MCKIAQNGGQSGLNLAIIIKLSLLFQSTKMMTESTVRRYKTCLKQWGQESWQTCHLEEAEAGMQAVKKRGLIYKANLGYLSKGFLILLYIFHLWFQSET